jgi:hypothetical protein
MNPLLEFLRRENNVTVDRLREVYRALCMQTHPDSGSGSDEGFKRLQREYAEALAELGREALRPSSASGRAAPRSSADPRQRLLEGLYLYTVRFYGKESEKLMADLITAAREYDRDLVTLLGSYTREFLSCFHSWESEGPVYYTHCLLVAAIKQMFYYFSMGLPHQKRLFFVLLQDLEARAGKLSPSRRDVLRGLARWLRQEGQKERVSLSFV